MQWRLGISKVFVSTLTLMAFCHSVLGLDTSRLWLPQSYQKHYLDLVRAAHVAEALERCQTVLEGTLDREHTQNGHPFYRILCRQENGLSYNEMVDGVSFETLTTRVQETEMSDADKERLREQQKAQEEAEIARRKAKNWALCKVHIERRTNMMIDMVMLNEGEPEPTSFTDTEVSFVVDFDAKSMWGKSLHYQATCSISPGEVVDVSLSKR